MLWQKKYHYKKAVLPIVHKEKYILKAFNKYKPDIVIGFGQSEEKDIEIEQRAKNVYEMEKPIGKKLINPKGRRYYYCNFKPKPINGTKLSNNTGTSVCNYSMYVLLEKIDRESLKTKLSFIHIPVGIKFQKVIPIIEKLTKQLYFFNRI